MLPLVFTYQWVLCWSALFFLVRGERRFIFPWLILLGGGSYVVLGENSGTMISKNQPWALFLTTIWVTQRSAMFGVAPLVAVVFLLFEGWKERSRAMIAGAGLVCALMPLAHTHFLLAVEFFRLCAFSPIA